MKMRLVLVLAVAGLALGGITACKDHNPTVVFTGDAGTDGKTEAGAPQDGGGSHDGTAAAEAASATDVGGPTVDVPLAVDLASDVNGVIDVANPVDADHAVDLNQAIDSPASIDGSGLAVDGTAGPAVDVGVDSSAPHDGGETGG